MEKSRQTRIGATQQLNPYDSPNEVFEEKASRLNLQLGGWLALILFTIAYSLGGIQAIHIILAGAVAGTALSPLILVLLRLHKANKYTGHVMLASGVALTLHIVFTAAMVELVRSKPFVMDLNPYDSVVINALNYCVPGAVLGFVVASVSPFQRTRMFWLGAISLATGITASLAYGYYFLGTVLSFRLADHVWWI